MPADIPTAVIERVTSAKQRPQMSLRRRIVILCLIWTVSLFPFLFLSRTTWFGRPLSDQQLGEYLHDDHNPRQIEYALGHIRQRMSRQDSSVAIWYPDLVRLSSHPVEAVRATDALVMGENAALPELREALIEQLSDASDLVRFNAAASLAGSGDSSGRGEIVRVVSAPNSPPEQLLKAMKALGHIGTDQDIPLLARYEAPIAEIPERVRQEAKVAADAIRARAAGKSN